MTQTRWGIVSTGRMADWFCSDFGSVPNGQLNAVCSRSSEAANAFAERYDIPHRFTTLDDMIASGEVDLVYIATPHTTHKALVLQALKQGMPVLCEKPIVTSVADMREVIACAEENNTYLAEAMWTWHLPAIQAAKAWVAEGRIGRLVHVKVDFGYPIPYAPDLREYDPKDAGGVLREMGIYSVAISRRFIDQDPNELHVVHQKAPNGVEYDLTAMSDFGDRTSVIGTSYRCRMGNAAYILGEEGYIRIPDAFRASRAELYQVDELIDVADFAREERGYCHIAVATSNDIQNGLRQSPVVPLSVSLSVQEDMKRILEAIGRGEEG